MSVVDPRIEAAAARLLQARHGEKSAITAELASQLGCSQQTAYRHLQTVMAPLRNSRKRRSDAGRCVVSREEALQVAALVEETRRQTGTGALPVNEALDIARRNGLVSAGHVNPETGEWVPVSIATMRRAMRQHHVSAAQLAMATPATRLSSPHPNHCWQIDASVSRQFYLADSGTEQMPKREFYRGKPQNFERIADRRLWRYVVTDHASGCIELFYVRGAESAANMIATLIHVMTPRAMGTMHGVPKILMADPGSAVTAAQTRNFITALGIEYQINAVGNARGKGQVENAQYIVETHFEAALKLQPAVSSLEEINGLAQEWARAFNATRIHSRTKLTRRDGWLRIKSTELVSAPSVAVLMSLPNSTPKACTVRDWMIKFGGRQYDIRGIPGGVLNGDRLQVIVNALAPDGVRVLLSGEEGSRPVHFLAPRIELTDWNFIAGAGEIGSSFRGVPETPTDAARKEIDRLAMQVDSDAEAAAARKAKRPAFGGNVDPMRPTREVAIAPSLPRAATPSKVIAPEVASPIADIMPPRPTLAIATLTTSAAALRLRPVLAHSGHAWSPDYIARLEARFAGAVPEDELGDIAAWLTDTRSNVRAIGGVA